MEATIRGGIFEREQLPAAMTQLRQEHLEAIRIDAIRWSDIPARGGLVATWSTTLSDPLAELLVVRDEDVADTFSWLNSYFAGISPITQWCRVVPVSDARRLARRPQTVDLGLRLGPWVGAILGECSVQAGLVQNLREVPGSAATSTATYVAGRAAAVWGGEVDLVDLAERHTFLSQGLRDTERPVSPAAILPIWALLSARVDIIDRQELRYLEPLADILSSSDVVSLDRDPVELVESFARSLAGHYNLPELQACAHGPQVERVRALDKLAGKLSPDGASHIAAALLGLGASFVEAGTPVSSELLRRYFREFPTAAIWQGAFAGAVHPMRVLNDQGGLGRLVAKAILARDDLEDRPSCDVAFDELIRWITPGRSLKQDIRGMSARTLNVEIALGVVAGFPFGKTETSAAQSRLRSDARSSDRARQQTRAQSDFDAVIGDLLRRVAALEELSGSQGTLDLAGPKSPKPRKR